MIMIMKMTKLSTMVKAITMVIMERQLFTITIAWQGN